MEKFTSLAIKTKHFFSQRKPTSYPVILNPTQKNEKAIGRVLFSYLEAPLLWTENSKKFRGHSNAWESREIVRIFLDLGYQVDAINFMDRTFVPQKHYDVVFDIFENLGLWSNYFEKKTKKILHCTGSDPYFQNKAEMSRVESVNNRRNSQYHPKRLIENPELTYKSLDVADAVSLIGNKRTKETYPQRFWDKIELVTVTASQLKEIKTKDNYVSQNREFLWFFGGGAVHKGLDLVLEVFSRNKDLTLNIIGDIENEIDFLAIYKNELFRSNNIHFYGHLYPRDKKFIEIVKNVFCFIAPTCSEEISPAVATCLQIGLYPIISRESGITLPKGCGIYLETCSIAEIEQKVRLVYLMPNKELENQIKNIQFEAIEKYSRNSFHSIMKKFLTNIIE